MNWLPISRHAPPQGVKVMTIIQDEQGSRNEQALVLKGRLWFLPDMSMYVYYEPTHWRSIEA